VAALTNVYKPHSSVSETQSTRAVVKTRHSPFAQTPASAESRGGEDMHSALKLFLDSVATETEAKRQTEHVEARHELVGSSAYSDNKKVRNAEMSEVHAAATTELRAVKKELQTIETEKEVNTSFIYLWPIIA